ncbi:hypothetical protein APSETT445_008954 [Aspergillus pseudonomiae]
MSPSLEQLLRRGVRIPDRTPEVAAQFAHGRNATDPFTVLPLEIKEIVAEQLSTRDILALRAVSRAMEGIFFSSRFWRTRFEINGERGFLYRAVRGASRGTGDSIDWQHLYHSTSTLPWNDEFDRMLEMWENFRWIRDACLSENRGQTPPLDFQGRALQHYHNTHWEETKVETVDIPPKLATIGVSILANGEDIVITGLEFYSEDGSSKSLGYKTPGAKTRTETEMASRIQHRHLSGYSSMSGNMDPHPLQDFYRPPGFHVLMDARSLGGSRQSLTSPEYDRLEEYWISALGVIIVNKTPGTLVILFDDKNEPRSSILPYKSIEYAQTVVSSREPNQNAVHNPLNPNPRSKLPSPIDKSDAMTIQPWHEKALAKQATAASKIPPEWRLPDSIQAQLTSDPGRNCLDIPAQSGLLTARELAITATEDATALLAKIANREYTAVEVTTAFSKRAAIAQQLTSCLTETFFDVALTRAKALDEHLASTGKTVGPLHGLPISLKDGFNVAGIPSTLGFVSFIDNPVPTTNSPLVDILLAAGAVIYVKTNIPQTLMIAESHNNVFGRVLNPHRLNLAAGGSSGGEGALVALRGSLLGVGTDIGGSIRIPALCCGVIGFKPSAGRVPFVGQTSPARPGLVGITPVAGPLCHSVRDADLFFKVVADSQPEDVDDQVHGLPWSSPTEPPKSSLTIGLLPEDLARPYHPNIQRTLSTAVKKLAAAGHQIVDLTGKCPSVKEISDLAMQFFQMDPDRTALGHLAASGEPWVPSLKYTFDPNGPGPEPTLRQLYDLNVQKAGATAAIRKVFLDNELDVILAPGHQSVAPVHDTFGLPIYTMLANLVDYPACIIPFGTADEAADAEFVRDIEYIPKYTPKEVEGAPCHVQLIGRRLKDELLVQHSKVVEGVLKGK